MLGGRWFLVLGSAAGPGGWFLLLLPATGLPLPPLLLLLLLRAKAGTAESGFPACCWRVPQMQQQVQTCHAHSGNQSQTQGLAGPQAEPVGAKAESSHWMLST